MPFTPEENAAKDKVAEFGDDLNRIEEGLKERLDAMTKEQLQAFVGQTTLNEMENQKQKKEDQDLAEKKAAAKAAGAKYKDVTDGNKAKTEYAKYLLEGMGVVGLSETTVND
jgi:ABC-type Na+ transport system ATPase subunit NatA